MKLIGILESPWPSVCLSICLSICEPLYPLCSTYCLGWIIWHKWSLESEVVLLVMTFQHGKSYSPSLIKSTNPWVHLLLLLHSETINYVNKARQTGTTWPFHQWVFTPNLREIWSEFHQIVRKWSPLNSAHATTAMLSWHVQNSVVILDWIAAKLCMVEICIDNQLVACVCGHHFYHFMVQPLLSKVLFAANQGGLHIEAP